MPDDAPSPFSLALDRVASDRERLVLTRRGTPVAALVSLEDLHLLERLTEAVEDQIDLEEATRILEDDTSEYLPWEEVARDL